MANLMSYASDGLTHASNTWKVAEAGTGAAQISYTTTDNITGTSYTWSSAFTVTNASVIEGVALRLARNNGNVVNITVGLSEDNGSTAAREVTIAASDLGDYVSAASTSYTWYFFKFGATLTGDGGSDYKIGVKLSGSASILVAKDATNGMCRLLRTGATAQATTGDNMFVMGDYTAAATYSAFTVTMDSTSSTDYGLVHVGARGTLAYAYAASTNYILKLSGDLYVQRDAVFTIGTAANPIPRNSTAVLNFDSSTNVEFGLLTYYGSTFTAQGLSRSSGKVVVNTLLSADIAQKTSTTISATAASPGVFTWTSNTLSNGDTILFTGISLITGISTNTVYYVVNNGTDGAGKFRLSLTKGGGDINTTGSNGSNMTAFATSDNTLDVATDTGWLSGDSVSIASTSRTYTQCENGTLSGDASSSLLTLTDALVYAHSGTSPTQAEVILLTRNVKIYGASSTLQAYINIAANSTVDVDWVEFYWLGSNTSAKKGIDWITSSGTISFAYSSFHNFTVSGSIALNCSSVTAASTSDVSYCVFYDNQQHHLIVANKMTVQNCIFMLSRNSSYASVQVASSVAPTSSDVFSNNIVVGSIGAGILFETTAPGFDRSVATFSGNTVHSCGADGFRDGGARGAVFTDLTVWRCNDYGVKMANSSYQYPSTSITYDGLVLFGNATANMLIDIGAIDVTIIDGFFNGDTTFSSQYGIYITSGTVCTLLSCDFGSSSGIKTTHSTADVYPAGSNSKNSTKMTMINCKFASSTEIGNLTSFTDNAFFSSQKHDQSTGTHKTWKRYGIVSYSTAADTYRTSSPGELLTPNSASGKLESSHKLVPVANTGTLTPTVYVYKSAAYNGNQPRLILKRNIALGITSDQIIATASGSTGSWLTLTGTAPTSGSATDDGVFEFVVDCDGTAGTAAVDDWSVV